MFAGSEFRVIFLSTAEPIDESGNSKNPTKSPCGQFVFNTAITRAKSLVVCAGNPFLLLKVEKNMEKVDADKSFWKDYIRRCIITKSFSVPSSKSNTIKLLEKIQKLVFNSEVTTSSNFDQQKLEDSIIKRLEKIVADRHRYKKCTIKIKEQQNEYQNWQIIQDSLNAEIDNGRESAHVKVTCELHIKSRRGAVGIPQSSQKDAIAINGLDNRKGAFDGDLVEVSVYGKDDDGQRYGRVTNIIEFQHPVKYVCEVSADEKNVIFFNPIDELVPGIVNLPTISRNILRHKPEVFGEVQKVYISVFEESSLDIDGDLSLKIKELIPFEIASSLLFVVKVLSWSPKFRKPLGAVIEALPRTNNSFITEKLLLVAHDIQQDDGSLVEEDFLVDESEAALNSQLKVYTDALAIDPQDVINRDDAVHIAPLDNKSNTFTCELTVLIVDVAKYIEKDSNLDKIAKRRGTSVYGGQVKHQTTPSGAIHMLPSAFSTSKLSLNDGNGIKPVIAVSAEVTINEGEVVEVKKGIPKEALLQCPVNLTYSMSQCIMNGQTPRGLRLLPERENKTKKMLDLLFKVAMKIRVGRLHDAAYNYQVTEPDEVDNWQSHLLIEELMIWANSHVAEYMIEECSDYAVLRCQPPPLAKELLDLKDAHKGALSFSLCYKSLESSEELQSDNRNLMLTSQTIQHLVRAYQNNDLAKMSRILSLEVNFPQLAMIEAAMISISRSAKYICAKNVPTNPEYDALSHHSIQCRYTHFSSPIRRYFDLVVQRILKALIEKKDMPYESSELENICRILNLKTKNSKGYSKDMDRAQMASYWEDEGMERTSAYVTSFLQKKQNLYLCFPFNQFREFMKRDDTMFDFSQLNYHRREQNVVSWQIVSVPLNNADYLIKCPQLASRDCQQENSEVKIIVYPLADGNGVQDDMAQNRRKIREHSLTIQDGNCTAELETWKLAQTCVRNPNQENIDSFMSKLSPPSQQGNPALSKDIITSIASSPLIRYTVKAKFGEGSLVNVWLSKSFRNPISSPNLHLIEVAPTVRICLQHMQNPSECFSGSQLQLSSRPCYTSKEDYVDLWSKALLAESSHDGVRTKEIILLKDAVLQWPKLVRIETSLDKAYYKCDDYLKLEICLEKFDMMDLVGIKPGDLVCARYEVADTKGKLINVVYHFYVSSVNIDNIEEKKKVHDVDRVEEETPEYLTITLGSYGEHGCKVSEKMQCILKKSNPFCELQIMKMPISFKLVSHN